MITQLIIISNYINMIHEKSSVFSSEIAWRLGIKWRLSFGLDFLALFTFLICLCNPQIEMLIEKLIDVDDMIRNGLWVDKWPVLWK